MAAPGPVGPSRRLRHPAELPFYALMVALNVIIIAALVRSAMVPPFLPPHLRQAPWAISMRAALLALLVLVPGVIVVRGLRRASIRGPAVPLPPAQYPRLHQAAGDFAARLGLRRRPHIIPANGTLNAFAGRVTGFDYVVLSSELLAHLHDDQDGLGFVLGHELGHIRLHHVSIWYQISVAYSHRIPLLGQTLSRLREYSCDAHGAYLSPRGVAGLALLSGRCAGTEIDLPELVRRSRMLRRLWVGLAQLPKSHPFIIRRLDRLFRTGLLQQGAHGGPG